jgi:hypothetical protein
MYMHNNTLNFMLLGLITLSSCHRSGETKDVQTDSTIVGTADTSSYQFVNGYPTTQTIQQAYDEADLNRAIQCYRFFYPSVSILATWEGNITGGVVPNKIFAMLDGTPEQLVFTPNSDTRYAGLTIDLSETGPMVIDIPPGPIMSVVNDLNQLYVMDLGLPGPDKGKGGKYLLLPPGYRGKAPAGYYTGMPTTNRILVLVRAIPLTGGADAAEALIKSVKVYPLNKTAGWTDPTWVNLNKPNLDFTPVPWETNIQYWSKLHDLIDKEPPYPRLPCHVWRAG